MNTTQTIIVRRIIRYYELIQRKYYEEQKLPKSQQTLYHYQTCLDNRMICNINCLDKHNDTTRMLSNIICKSISYAKLNEHDERAGIRDMIKYCWLDIINPIYFVSGKDNRYEDLMYDVRRHGIYYTSRDVFSNKLTPNTCEIAKLLTEGHIKVSYFGRRGRIEYDGNISGFDKIMKQNNMLYKASYIMFILDLFALFDILNTDISNTIKWLIADII